jgi:hypothetical protein
MHRIVFDVICQASLLAIDLRLLVVEHPAQIPTIHGVTASLRA